MAATMIAALEHCLEASAQRLAELTDAAASPRARERCARLLAALPLTCSALKAKAREDARLPFLRWYERCRGGRTVSNGHFLDGISYGLALFAGPTSITLPASDLKKLRLGDVLYDRWRTVVSLEGMLNGSAKMAELASNNMLSDLPAGLSPRVHILFSRTRAVCQGMRRHKPAANFAQCRHQECHRLFYRGSPGEAERIVVDEVHPLPAAHEFGFWYVASGGPGLKAHACQFCSRECARQWRRQFNAAVPSMDDATLVNETRCRKDGRSRVPEALRCALKRNEVVSRAMRGADKPRRFPAVSSMDIDRERARRVRLLNVDLGLLIISGILADSKALSEGKVLPGSSEGWRERIGLFAKPLKTVREIYHSTHTGGKLVYNLLVPEPFVDKLKRSIKQIL